MALPRPRTALPSGSSADGPVSLARTVLADLSCSLPALTTERTRSCVRDLELAISRTRAELRSCADAHTAVLDRSQTLAEEVTEAVHDLSTGVTGLQDVLSNAQTGLVPAVYRTLATHSDAAQAAMDAYRISALLHPLSQCVSRLSEIYRLTADGRIPEAAVECLALSEWCLQPGSASLARQTQIWSDLMMRLRAIEETTQTQLAEACRHAVYFDVSKSQTILTVRQATEFPKYTTFYDLNTVVSAMSESTISELSAQLRKELLIKIVDPILDTGASVTLFDDHVVLNPSDDPQPPIIQNLSIIVTFLTGSLPEKLMKSVRMHLSSAVLDRVLVPAMPQTISGLRVFLVLLQAAVKLEQQITYEVTIRRWAEDVGLHYERARRKAVLAQARSLLLDDQVFHELIQPDPSEDGTPLPPASEDEADAGWDFDFANSSGVSQVADADSLETGGGDTVTNSQGSTALAAQPDGEEDEDDPWDDVDTSPGQSTVGLETPVGNPGLVQQLQMGPRYTSGHNRYPISRRAQAILSIIVDTLKESHDLLLQHDLTSRRSPLGSVLYSVAPITVDLFRALPPTNLAAARFVVLCNDCSYLASQLETQGRAVPAEYQDKLMSAVKKLYSMEKHTLALATSEQIDIVRQTLAPAKHFVDTANDEQAIRSENAVEGTLLHCEGVAREWQLLLPFETYASSMGAVVDVLLADVLNSVLRLSDITESESNRLNRFCMRLRKVEDLFVRVPGHDSEIPTYVSCWFKFNYLSTLLEGNLVDITDLYREGHLVDFSPQELVSLVKALFADTSVRARTIDMLLAGPP